MKRSVVLILVLNTVCAFTPIPHEIVYIAGCFLNGTAEVQFEFDAEEMFYVDFQKKEVEYTLPTFLYPDPSQVLAGPSILGGSLENREICLDLIARVTAEEKNPPEEKGTIYSHGLSRCQFSSYDGHDAVYLEQYYFNKPNGNWLYQIHSYLEYTPRHGEKITCMVEHASLKEPTLYDWEPVSDPGMNKIIVGAAGLLLGLVFSVAGLIYFKMKSVVAHEVVIIVGCFENGTTEVQAEFDTEEVLYVDFDKQDMVYTVPPYLMMNPRETFGDIAVYNNARKAKNTCPAVLAYCKAEEKNPPEVTVDPNVRLRSAEAASSRHPAMLICSAYNFYPRHISLTWLRDGEVVTSGVMSTDVLSNGNWLYQIHTYLEYTPKPGEKITCKVEHVSLKEPKLYDWDPLSESQRNKIAVGTAGLVLGLVFLFAGLIYYKKKITTDRVLVPTRKGFAKTAVLL
ncbi:uncharacterized protein AKAME5_001524400 [Lates japonicus]|uniref:Ig-like domain-containing protein n=1 Tax=Lates japonicus TaxID=270547 RepID=A0AAD3RAW5_LATJO|nr:uncharacterized protein AKAME5_001524400 [Lates japonicus]